MKSNILGSKDPGEFVKVQYLQDNVSTTVSKDTVTPANSRPLPTQIMKADGTAVDFATQTTLAALEAKVPANLSVTASRLIVDGSQVTQPISAASLPLPSGAATESTLSAVNTKLPSLVSGRVPVDGSGVTQPVSGSFLTDAQLRASAVPVTGPLTDTQLRASAVPVSGPLTDAQIRATPLPISGTVSTGLTQPLTDAQLRATAVPVSGPLTDTQLRASAVPVSVAGVATETTLAALNTKIPAQGQAAMAASIPVVIANNQSSLPVTASGTPTAGTVTQAAVTVGTTAVRLTVSGAAPNAARKKLQFIIEPGGADNFFMGSSSVASSGANRGIRLYPGTLYTYDHNANDFYIISDTASQTVFIMEHT